MKIIHLWSNSTGAIGPVMDDVCVCACTCLCYIEGTKCPHNKDSKTWHLVPMREKNFKIVNDVYLKV